MLPCVFYLVASLLARNLVIWILIHLLIFLKGSNYDEPIASELSALDYLYEVSLEIRESGNCDEVLKEENYKVIHDSSLNEKHDCNDVVINSININCANNMKNPKIGDANFAMSTTCCNDHDWGDSSYDLENLFKPMMNIISIIMFAIILKVSLEECQL